MRNTRKRKKKNQKEKKTIILLYVFIVITVVAFISIISLNIINSKKHNKEEEKKDVIEKENIIKNNTEKEENSEQKKDITFTMTAIGDIMCHNTQYWDAYNKTTGKYDFSYVFDEIKKYTTDSDITVGSLETSFAGEERGYSNYPIFNTPDNLAYSIKDIGVDVVSTAGNHCLDMGFSGLSRTIDVLDEAKINHLGTYKTQEDQDTILMKKVKGLNIAFIDYTYGTNGIPIPNGKEYCVNLIDKELINKHIELAKKQKPDVIVACMHWGTEYQTKSNETQNELANYLLKNGVDIILGNHPHVLQQMEKREVVLEDGTTKDGFVIYALGNFICDQNAENTRNSIILDLKVTKHTNGKVTIDKAEYTPIYMYKNPNLSIKRMKLLDIEKTIENYENGIDKSIGSTSYEYLKKQLQKIKEIVGNEI